MSQLNGIARDEPPVAVDFGPLSVRAEDHDSARETFHPHCTNVHKNRVDVSTLKNNEIDSCTNA